MDLSKAVRLGYADVILSSISCPVYDAFAIPLNVTYPYVLVSAQTSVQRNVKRCKIYDATINLDIVTGKREPFGFNEADDIAFEIESLVNPDTYTDIDLSSYGFKIGDTKFGGEARLSNKNESHYINRKVITYNHLISKL